MFNWISKTIIKTLNAPLWNPISTSSQPNMMGSMNSHISTTNKRVYWAGHRHISIFVTSPLFWKHAHITVIFITAWQTLARALYESRKAWMRSPNYARDRSLDSPNNSALASAGLSMATIGWKESHDIGGRRTGHRVRSGWLAVWHWCQRETAGHSESTPRSSAERAAVIGHFMFVTNPNWLKYCWEEGRHREGLEFATERESRIPQNCLQISTHSSRHSSWKRQRSEVKKCRNEDNQTQRHPAN